MKDGVYRLVVRIDGVETEAFAKVERGFFEGLGILSHLRGYFRPGDLPLPLGSVPIDDLLSMAGTGRDRTR